MHSRSSSENLADPFAPSGEQHFAQLLASSMETASGSDREIHGVRVGTLVGFTDDAHAPLVTYPGQQGTAAMAARATLDLHAAHIGQRVMLLFENADPCLPIIVGCLRTSHSMAVPGLAGQIDVDADGRRIVVSASEQIVLRCGRASITLTKEGKLIVQGTYVSNQSSGVLRLKGGSVQIN
jgi:Domain of unknown function (DUF6484)